MNSFWVVVIGAVIITAAYNLYAKRIDRTVIQADASTTTPARMYMDGADFVPTSRFVLYGYHFKSIAAAGPIVGVITAAALWGWLPAIIWLMLGVSFIGWASDYSAIMVAVRNDGNSLSAIAHRLITPRTRTILFVFIFFYLLLVGAAFVGIMAAILDARPDVVFGVLVLALMGLLAGYMIYRARANLMLTTVVVVGVTLLAMTLGPVGVTFVSGKPPTWSEGPISGVVNSINSNVNSGGAMYGVQDPTGADPRISRDAKGKPVNGRSYNAATGTMISPLTDPAVAKFKLDAFSSFVPTQVTGAFQPLWPMLFVTIACGAISGWHALFGSVGTARQIEYETDALPVGGGGMFSENTLALLSLVAVAITGLTGVSGFAAGVGNLLNVVTGGALSVTYGTALGFGVFVVIVLTVVQLVFRVMRVTLGEWLGNAWVGFKNQHIATIISSVVVLFFVLSGTWVYLWQLFGASNQLMAALSLLIVTVWLAATRRNPAYAGIPMVFMYVTTMAATLVTAWNLYKTVATKAGVATISVLGGWAMIGVAVLLFVAALVIAWDGWSAWVRYRGREAAEARPAPTG